jgi:transposase-like protein
MSEEKGNPRNTQKIMPRSDEVQRKFAKKKSMDDFSGKEGIFACLFAHTIEEKLETELSEHLGNETYEAKGQNSGNNRNGRYAKKPRQHSGAAAVVSLRSWKRIFRNRILVTVSVLISSV